MQMICADFQQRRCSAFFLESDCEPSDDTIDQYLYDTAVRLNVSGRGEASVADQRESESYDGNCLHVHEGVISSAYGTANGSRKTKFISDPYELTGVFRKRAGQIRDILGDRCDDSLRQESGDEQRRAEDIATKLIGAFRLAKTPEQREKIRRLEDEVIRDLSSSIDRETRIGNANIFCGVIHVAGDSVYPEPPGSLFVEQDSVFAPEFFSHENAISLQKSRTEGLSGGLA